MARKFLSPLPNCLRSRIAFSNEDLPPPLPPSSSCFLPGLYSKLAKHRKLSMKIRVSIAICYPDTLAGSPLLQIQVHRQLFRGSTDCARQAQLRDVVGEHAVDVIELGAGDGFLRLHDFYILADAGRVALTG